GRGPAEPSVGSPAPPTRRPVNERTSAKAIRVGINGVGRNGRLVYRIARQGGGRGDIEIVAVNDLVPADNLAYLLKYDTMHGRFRIRGEAADIEAGDNSFTVNGQATKTMAVKDPAELPWGDLGVDYVLECTGLYTRGADARKHIDGRGGGGAKRVVISAPTKTPEEVRTFCYK